jgi:hypothetical protein
MCRYIVVSQPDCDDPEEQLRVNLTHLAETRRSCNA